MICMCSHDAEFPEDTWNLYQHIERVEGLNVVGDAAAARGVFKPHARRTTVEPFVESDTDGELLLRVWFIAPVNIKRICVASIGGDEDAQPVGCRCFTGTAVEGLSFDGLDDANPAQIIDEIPLDAEVDESVLLLPRYFTQITFLLLYFHGNRGDVEQTRISYIGLQGEHTHAKREAVEAKYELIPNAEDKAEAWRQLGLDKQGAYGRMS
eukprot:TRINITY_DN12365_c0_g1_i1.p2 TRINITY_DN12365_c0_g1~~TRINITY_DN12365_c0_g1_i1.p2  ORF type:complete len:210 (-),score=46.94 TRINITY_DN12365_c0_g1_i1:55-684(-)